MRLGVSKRACASIALAACLLPAGTVSGGRPRNTVSREYSEARALFEKVWEPGEAAPSGGDGVGPLYNERSCVGCHHQGGNGGAGDNRRNVTILSAVPGEPTGQKTTFQGELEALHPGFRNRNSIVLHRHATSTAGQERLDAIGRFGLVQTRDDFFAIEHSQRNTPALFGAGLIDRISDEALLAAEKRTFPAFPEVKGRVSRLRNGRLGRFGWKGQTSRLDDFVLAACANELGLEVRGHHQPSLISAAEFDPKALSLDLSDHDCDLLTRFVANLPAPAVRAVGEAQRGSLLFQSVGCATCHAPTLDGVRGLYSDLLLHDLGDRVRGSGGYGTPSTITDRAPGGATSATGEAGPTEWRTTPLWGVADSAPYFHDGRAPNLHDAILLHGGEADKTSTRYASLPAADRKALIAFLCSQVAPAQPGRTAEGRPRGKRN